LLRSVERDFSRLSGIVKPVIWLDTIRDLPILEIHSAQFLKVLEVGSVATNVFYAESTISPST
jgi:hypothetical protein